MTAPIPDALPTTPARPARPALAEWEAVALALAAFDISVDVDYFDDDSGEWARREFGMEARRLITAFDAIAAHRFTPAAPVRICTDNTCPACGWPELIAVGPSFAAGPERMRCDKCGFDQSIADWQAG